MHIRQRLRRRLSLHQRLALRRRLPRPLTSCIFTGRSGRTLPIQPSFGRLIVALQSLLDRNAAFLTFCQNFAGRILILADPIRNEPARRQSSDEDLLASVSRAHPAADIHLTATASNGFEAAETGSVPDLLRMHKNPEPPQSLQHRTGRRVVGAPVRQCSRTTKPEGMTDSRDLLSEQVRLQLGL